MHANDSSTSDSQVARFQAITDSIRVSAFPAYLPEASNPDAGIFSFSYRIKIENLGDQTVQLLERHWLVFSAEKEHAEVIGPGVVGLQPILQPGQTHEYMSGSAINDPVGAMQGTYTFKYITGPTKSELFKVIIPRFELIYAAALN